MILTRQFKTGPAATRWGLIFLPDDYDVTNKYPLIMFAHGVGEASWNSESETASLYTHGVFPFLRGKTEWKFLSPIDKTPHSFIVVAIQGHKGWSISAKEMSYALENDIYINYNINKNGVFITGLSAGGATTMDSITLPETMVHYAAAVPMSTASPGYLTNIKLTADQKIKVWAFHGRNDTGMTEVWQTIRFQQALEAQNRKLFRPTYDDSGHGPWNRWYDPNYREDIAGKRMNLYEFFLASMKDVVGRDELDINLPLVGTTTTSTTTSTTTTKAQPFVLDTARTISVPNGTSVIDLDASKSTGWKVLWWEIVEKPANSVAHFGFRNYDSPYWKIYNLSDGRYVLKLVGQDRYGSTKTVDVTLNVGTTTTTSTTTTTTTTIRGGGGGIDVPIDDDLNIPIPIKNPIKSITIEFEDGNIIKY